jgi:hypothetical protein
MYAEKMRKKSKITNSVRFIRYINVKFKGAKNQKKEDTHHQVPRINRHLKKKLIYPGSSGI